MVWGRYYWASLEQAGKFWLLTYDLAKAIRLCLNDCFTQIDNDQGASRRRKLCTLYIQTVLNCNCFHVDVISCRQANELNGNETPSQDLAIELIQWITLVMTNTNELSLCNQFNDAYEKPLRHWLHCVRKPTREFQFLANVEAFLIFNDGLIIYM